MLDCATGSWPQGDVICTLTPNNNNDDEEEVGRTEWEM